MNDRHVYMKNMKSEQMSIICVHVESRHHIATAGNSNGRDKSCAQGQLRCFHFLQDPC